MSARTVLNVTEMMLREGHPAEEVDEMLNPPSREEQLAARAAHLRDLGIDVA